MQPRFKKRVQTQDGSSIPQIKFDIGGGFKNVKPTCAPFGKKHYGEFLLGTGSFFCCVKMVIK